jgi:hypothetical protein
MGRAIAYSPGVGTGRTESQRLCADDTTSNSRRCPLGGQSSLGLFGVTDRCHASNAARLAIQAKAPAAPQAPDQPRIIGGLSFGQQRRPVGFEEDAAAEYEAHLAEIAEARAHQLDEEADRYACSFAGAGYTEYLMACEG